MERLNEIQIIASFLISNPLSFVEITIILLLGVICSILIATKEDISQRKTDTYYAHSRTQMSMLKLRVSRA